VRTAILVVMLTTAGTARAHDFTPGVLSLIEVAPGTYRWQLTEPVDSGGPPMRVTPRFPAHCRATELLECGERGLEGVISFDGLHDPRVRVVVLVRTLDGRRAEHMVDGGDPRIELERSPGGEWIEWLELGVEHVLLGFDHLAFLLGLLLVTGIDRRVLLTVTAFTIAHSATLALATLGWVELAPAPVEAAIASSVVLVAREALHREQTFTRRAPWLVALAFGLVHGLGFAGAIREIGVPDGSVATALLSFNAGVELGQLGVVAIAALIVWAARERLNELRRPLCYALGALGAWWTIERTIAIVWS
jgi:hydrogenase/urease accessory protein HupE